MSYETRIGWRYLYSGSGGSRRHTIVVRVALLTCLVSMVLGAVLFEYSQSGWGILLVSFGSLGTILFSLLSVFTVFTTVSMLGVVLGVAAMVVVLSVTSGFQQQFQDKVLGVNAHVIVMRNDRMPFGDYQAIEALARDADEQVLAVQPFILLEMQVTRGMGYATGVAIKGIDAERIDSVLDLHNHMIEGSVESLKDDKTKDGAPPAIIIGRTLGEKLKAKVGDRVTVVVPPLQKKHAGDLQALIEASQSREFVITGIFYSGFMEYDERLMYTNLGNMQSLLDWKDKVMGVELKVEDVTRADQIAANLSDTLARSHGFGWQVQDWHELNKNLFKALTLQKIALVIVLTVIIVVATFNMVSALTMMVIDKTREIAILRSMGATSKGIGAIFQVVGLCIGAVGTMCGLGIGIYLCRMLSEYNYRLDPKVYFIDRLPVLVDPKEIVLVAAITMVICAVATWFPASKASELTPVEGLRYD